MNQRQQAFLNEYLISGNATFSAIKAGYSKKTANEQGARLLTKANILAAIKAHQAAMAAKTNVTIERVVLELTKVAFADIGQVLDVENDEVRVKSLSELSGDIRAAISEITETDNKFGSRRSVKLHSKLSALDMLMRHIGGYVTVQDLVDKLSEQDIESITNKILSRINTHENKK